MCVGLRGEGRLWEAPLPQESCSVQRAGWAGGAVGLRASEPWGIGTQWQLPVSSCREREGVWSAEIFS